MEPFVSGFNFHLLYRECVKIFIMNRPCNILYLLLFLNTKGNKRLDVRTAPYTYYGYILCLHSWQLSVWNAMFNDEIAACKVNVCGCTVSIKYGKISKLNHNIYRMHMYILLTGYSQAAGQNRRFLRMGGWYILLASTMMTQVSLPVFIQEPNYCCFVRPMRSLSDGVIPR